MTLEISSPLGKEAMSFWEGPSRRLKCWSKTNFITKFKRSGGKRLAFMVRCVVHSNSAVGCSRAARWFVRLFNQIPCKFKLMAPSYFILAGLSCSHPNSYYTVYGDKVRPSRSAPRKREGSHNLELKSSAPAVLTSDIELKPCRQYARKLNCGGWTVLLSPYTTYLVAKPVDMLYRMSHPKTNSLWPLGTPAQLRQLVRALWVEYSHLPAPDWTVPHSQQGPTSSPNTPLRRSYFPT